MTSLHTATRHDFQVGAQAVHGGDASIVGGATIRHDFSTCINAFGPSESVRDAVRNCDISAYPDRYCTAARNAAANVWNRSPQEIICSAGAAELIQAVCAAYIAAGDYVSVVEPAFGEYRRAAESCGAHIFGLQSPIWGDRQAWNTFALEVTHHIRLTSPKLAFLATPTSPTGFQLSMEMLHLIADACLDSGTLFVLDQSYDAFADTPLGTPALAGHPNVLHVRSITKDHALAGIRVAFGVAAPDVIGVIERARAPWSTSSLAQAAAVASFEMEATTFAKHTVAAIKCEARRIANELRSHGMLVEESSTHYLLINVGDAAHFQQQLAMNHHILVRDCTSFGLPAHIRVAARTPGENSLLMNAIRYCSAASNRGIRD